MLDKIPFTFLRQRQLSLTTCYYYSHELSKGYSNLEWIRTTDLHINSVALYPIGATRFHRSRFNIKFDNV